MTDPLDSSRARELIQAAKGGDREAIGELLAAYRSYLGTITEAEIDGALGARLDSSDIVQQTCLSAIRRIGDFDGAEQGQFVAWLKQVHVRNIQDAMRRAVLPEAERMLVITAVPRLSVLQSTWQA